jgi:hypothetical protein
MREEPATLTPVLSQREREGNTTCYLSLLPGRKALRILLEVALARERILRAGVGRGATWRIQRDKSQCFSCPRTFSFFLWWMYGMEWLRNDCPALISPGGLRLNPEGKKVAPL